MTMRAECNLEDLSLQYALLYPYLWSCRICYPLLKTSFQNDLDSMERFHADSENGYTHVTTVHNFWIPSEIKLLDERSYGRTGTSRGTRHSS